MRGSLKNRQLRPRIGIIGTGFGVRTVLQAFLARNDVDVVMICGQDPVRTSELAVRHGVPSSTTNYRELCQSKEIDIVCVASPPYLHREMVIASMTAGKHVICEKPLATCSVEAEEIASLSRHFKGKYYLVNHQLRFHHDIRQLRRLLLSGAVGRPYLVRLHQESKDFFKDDADWKWWFERDKGGGLLLAIGPHLFDLVRYWFGRCTQVQAHLEVLPDLRFDNAFRRKIEVETAFSAMLMMEGSTTVLISATAGGCAPKKSLQISIYGTAGELHFHTDAGLTHIQKNGHKSIYPRKNPEQSSDTSFFREAYDDFLDVLVPSIQKGYISIPEAATLDDGVGSLNIIDAVRAASENNRVVELDELPPRYKHIPRADSQLSFDIKTGDTRSSKMIRPKSKQFHISSGRAMVSLGPYKKRIPCPYSCEFCYVPVGFSKYPTLNPEQIVAQLAWRRYHENYDRVYISGDTDSFYPGRDGIGLLEALTLLNVDLLFTTRAIFKQTDIDRISKVSRIQRASGLLVFACISICGLESALILEPNAPPPENRIEQLRALSNIGCTTILALRPFLPVIPIDEYNEILDKCAGFIDCVLGEKWYIDSNGILEDKVLGPGKRLPAEECEEVQMDFDSNENSWKVWKAESVSTVVKMRCKKFGIPFFMRSDPAVDFFRKGQARETSIVEPSHD